MDFCSKMNNFCFVCGKFTVDRNSRTKYGQFQTIYKAYYKDKEWNDDIYVPKIGCSACYKSLQKWSTQKSDKEPKIKPKYKEPMSWFNPGGHKPEECYFCVNFVSGTNVSKQTSVRYIATINTVLPVEHNKTSPPLQLPQEEERLVDEPMDMEIESSTEFFQPSTSSEYVPPIPVISNPVLVNQNYLEHMARKLELSQRKSATLASLLKNNNLLEPGVTISSQKKRQAEFIPFFETENDISYCVDIHGLMQALHIDYDVEDWRLFIDASKSGLKAVLLHNDNIFMPVPIAYSRTLKETYASMRLIFEKVKYNDHKWDVSGDLKVVALIMGLQLGRTKNSCFICTWISTAKIDHYHATWEKRGEFVIGIMNVKENSLVPPEKILLPTLHIKLGLISSFVRKLNKEDDAFKYLKVLFPKLSTAKIGAGELNEAHCLRDVLTKTCFLIYFILIPGVFNGPDIRKMMASEKFYTLLSPFEKEAFSNIKSVVENFLGNHRAANYKEIIHNMLQSFSRLKINMSPKIHYLHQHLDFFKENLGKISDEHGERFHQQIKKFEERFQGKPMENMLAEYVWNSFEDEEEQQCLQMGFMPRSRSAMQMRSDRLSLL